MDQVVDSISTTFYQIEPGYQLYLTGAVLNGLSYGNVVSVPQLVERTDPEFHLFQNYPNPFNPTTTIAFRCGQNEQGRLVVYDINGRLVKTLFEGALEMGSHSVIWDGTNGGGASVSTGVYNCRLEAGIHTRLSRFMLLLH